MSLFAPRASEESEFNYLAQAAVTINFPEPTYQSESRVLIAYLVLSNISARA